MRLPCLREGKKMAKACKFASKHIHLDRQLELRISHYPPTQIEAVVFDNPHQSPLVIKIWKLEEQGIYVYCNCANRCKSNEEIIKPRLPQDIDAQMQSEISGFKNKFGIHQNKVKISMINNYQLSMFDYVDNLKLNGDWKNRKLIQQIREGFDTLPDEEEENPSLYENLVIKAVQKTREKEFVEGEKLLKEAIMFSPSHPEAYRLSGNLYKMQGRLKEAEKNFSLALFYAKKMGMDNSLLIKLEEEITSIKELKKKKQEKEEMKIPIVKKETEPQTHYQPQVKVSIQFDNSNQQILAAVENGRFDLPEFFNLLLSGQRISLLQGFEQLLCLESVKIDHYPYQIDTARKVLQRFGGRTILADEVGLGKTIEAGLVLKEYSMRGLVSKVLILTVPSLVSQWKEEMEAKFDLRFMTTDDAEFDTEETNFWTKYDLIIASVHTAKRENHRQVIHQLEYDLLIIDEAHHLKSKSTLSWQFVNEIKKKFVLLLTATPVQNNLEELYNMITILKPGQLKTLATFKRNFVTRGNPKKPKNKEKLRELLAEVMIRNTRSQVDIKLPKRHARTVKIHLSPQEMAIYRRVSEFIKNEYSHNTALNKFLLMMLQREIGSSVMAVRPTLKKISENPNTDEAKRKTLLELYNETAGINEGTKTNALLKIIHSLNGEKCLIFTQFLETQKVIYQCLSQAGISTSIFNGQMPSSDKNFNVRQFQDTNQILISTEAGGEGRNLQFCHIMLNYDLPWNPMRIEQRVGRICRVGQKNQTYVFNLSSQETIEAYILKILDEKINMFELVIGEMDMILGNLDEDKGFEETMMEIWTGSTSKDELEGKIQEFGNQLQSAKQSYIATKELEEALFGEDYEVE